WAEVDYLLWFVSDGRVRAPLVSAGPAGTLGLLNRGVGSVFGPADLDYGTFSGVRAEVGGWLDSDRTLGLAASGFYLGRQLTSFTPSVDPRATALGRPFLDTTRSEERRVGEERRPRR